MKQNRNSIPKITARALRKCTQFYMDAVHAYCTPSEYLALCWHFGAKPRDIEYYAEKVKKGVGNPANHYIHVKKWKDNFPISRYACLDCCIDKEYY